jgi:hypothetical protein
MGGAECVRRHRAHLDVTLLLPSRPSDQRATRIALNCREIQGKKLKNLGPHSHGCLGTR